MHWPFLSFTLKIAQIEKITLTVKRYHSYLSSLFCYMSLFHYLFRPLLLTLLPHSALIL